MSPKVDIPIYLPSETAIWYNCIEGGNHIYEYTFRSYWHYSRF